MGLSLIYKYGPPGGRWVSNEQVPNRKCWTGLASTSHPQQTRIFTVRLDKSSQTPGTRNKLERLPPSLLPLTRGTEEEPIFLLRQTAPPVQTPHSSCAHAATATAATTAAAALPPSTCSRPNAGAVLSGSVRPVPCPSSCGETEAQGRLEHKGTRDSLCSLVLFLTELWEGRAV